MHGIGADPHLYAMNNGIDNDQMLFNIDEQHHTSSADSLATLLESE